MNDTQLKLASISMDLKRVALSYYRNSNATAQTFSKEALKRSNEINIKSLKPYLAKILANLKTILNQKDKLKVAEDALMYSTILQNSVTSSEEKTDL
ncbi:hypothetical protein A2716_02555 [candidate division WWE3 bacterium RIFCSPHIGHO2_01_FULL_40_23]|uniref:HEPN domain-containing protein n=1 Tax=candidate division WWE3 bacterium RIFCSPLOWO2_01_FULL_41_18 TaxID=1802625 RepID=A0A1F4VF39_UNCKA|nr:MAG: hypothetical protein A2716_02555 [candidate division WWE3 bacterium RIFCSPHIGHO2_01_FULL_40_23]OGC55866.1 MAG: hypothetical protein A3A78_02405 [candidate division WWE3 bacterium RIFCSPLOWO2_01_FULL_41_18]